MILRSNHKVSFYSRIQLIAIDILPTIFSTLIVSIGLVVSTEITGYREENLRSPVNKQQCTCDCWDGFFRGRYSRGGYKLFYFNYERQMMIILCLVLFYGELLRRYIKKIVFDKQYILLLLIPAVYSNFYGIWNIINYINDYDYHRMLKSQIYFSLTELLATYIFYECLIHRNSLEELSLSMIYLLFSISILHIIIAFGELNFDQIRRNISLLASDFICLIWTINILFRNSRLKSNMRTCSKWILITFCLWSFYHMFCPFRE